MTLYGVIDRPSETGTGDWLTVWSGSFMSSFEGQGIARPGAKQITITLDWVGKAIVKLPEGVTFPRTEKNYEVIDAAINEQINAFIERLDRIPDLPDGDDGHPSELPDPAAPGADDR